MNPPCNPLHILIVDDEDDMCWVLQRIVESEGHSSKAATSGHAALRLLENELFHLAFVDAKLPDMEGIDLVASLRSLRPGLPCVLVSGYLYDDDDLVKTSLATQLISGFIEKPFLLAQVRDAMRRVSPAS